MEYYYTHSSNIDTEQSSLIIRGEEYKHLTKVLRKTRNDVIFVTDGELNVYECIIRSKEKDVLKCRVLKKYYNINEPKLKITLCLGLLKNLTRFEYAIEKAVEIGIYDIIPLISEYTINKTGLSSIKTKRLNSIVLSAMKQSQRCHLPEVKRIMKLEELINFSNTFENKIVMYEYEKSENKIDNRKFDNNCLLLIGPEGGFSYNEIQKLKKHNWKVKSLGERKLRAETAAILSIYEILKNIN
jgi:16S rRNA (uracil1498-N3)-methyltransferase